MYGSPIHCHPWQSVPYGEIINTPIKSLLRIYCALPKCLCLGNVPCVGSLVPCYCTCICLGLFPGPGNGQGEGTMLFAICLALFSGPANGQGDGTMLCLCSLVPCYMLRLIPRTCQWYHAIHACSLIPSMAVVPCYAYRLIGTMLYICL